ARATPVHPPAHDPPRQPDPGLPDPLDPDAVRGLGQNACMVLGKERRETVSYAQRLRRDRLAVGTSGNISIRSGDLVAVTPSGVDYDELTADKVGVHRLDGTPVEARLAPTTEMPMHLAVYQRTTARAIVHTH